MSTAVSTRPVPHSTETLAALALAEARRYARHPLYLFGAGLLAAGTALSIARKSPADVGVEESVAAAFFLGVFGFVIAHRLTMSLRRTGDLADTAPVTSQRRTAALCLACLVPAATAIVLVLALVASASIWPPTLPGGHVAWFGYEPNAAVWGVLIGDVVIASLGGPLLGVAVARWAPFRGSALLGTTLLVFAVIFAQAVPSPWYAAFPWIIFSNENVVGGEYQTSWIVDAVSPLWWSGYAACLCGLAVVAALLRGAPHPGRLLSMGALLAAVGLGCLLISMS